MKKKFLKNIYLKSSLDAKDYPIRKELKYYCLYVNHCIYLFRHTKAIVCGYVNKETIRLKNKER